MPAQEPDKRGSGWKVYTSGTEHFERVLIEATYRLTVSVQLCQLID